MRMASFIGRDGKRYFTITLKGRRASHAAISAREAQAMRLMGFRFSRFDIARSDFELATPYEFAHLTDRDTLTFVQ